MNSFKHRTRSSRPQQKNVSTTWISVGESTKMLHNLYAQYPNFPDTRSDFRVGNDDFVME
jgi:hypothetical protein